MELHHLALRTRDLDRLCAFYESIFGLSRAREQPGQSVWLALGDAVLMIELAEPHEPQIPAGSLELVAFRVDDRGRAAVRERLRGLGLAPESETEHTTYFRDPDGRRVGVSTHPLTREGQPGRGGQTGRVA